MDRVVENQVSYPKEDYHVEKNIFTPLIRVGISFLYP